MCRRLFPQMDKVGLEKQCAEVGMVTELQVWGDRRKGGALDPNGIL